MSGLRYPMDKPPRWRWPLIWAAAGLLAFIASYALSRAPLFVERVYSAGAWPWVSQTLSRLTGLLPIAVAELLIAAYLLWLIATGARALYAAARRQRRWRNAFAGGVRRAIRDFGCIVFFFYVLWGFNYARAPFASRAGWPEFEGADVTELAALAEQAVRMTNDAYRQLHGSEDAGQPTKLPADIRALESSINEGWVRATSLLKLSPVAAAKYGPVKWPISSSLQHLGLMGLYSPFTAESNLPRDLPAAAVPHTMAHEKAHQRATTGEGEANFLGFVAAALADDPLSRYSAGTFASRQLLALVAQKSGPEARRIAGLQYAGVLRDRDDLRQYFRKYSGIAPMIAGVVNHRYLRANRIRGGVQDYSQSAGLLVTFARTHGALPGSSSSVQVDRAGQ